MKTVDDETARLVYIFWTETEKGDTRDITFIGSDFTVKSESATTSVDGQGGHCQRQGHGCQVLHRL